MRTGKHVKADLLKALKESVDERFCNKGFKRRRGSVNYIRLVGDARQAIAFDASFFPKYQRDAEVHIHPAMHLSMKSVCDEALKLVGGNKMLLANSPDMILNQPIEFSAPKEAFVRWLAAGAQEINMSVLEITAFIEAWVIPMFDVLKTPADLVGFYRENDNRIMKQRHWFLYVAGAEIAQGNRGNALAVLEANFGSPGLKARYSVAFEQLEVG